MEKTWKPTTAGILSIISGIGGMGQGGFFLVLLGRLSQIDWEKWLDKWGEAWGPGMCGPGILRYLLETGAPRHHFTGRWHCYDCPRGNNANWWYPRNPA